MRMQKKKKKKKKCLKRILPSNVFLHKCKLVSSSLCDFCHMEIETVIFSILYSLFFILSVLQFCKQHENNT